MRDAVRRRWVHDDPARRRDRRRVRAAVGQTPETCRRDLQARLAEHRLAVPEHYVLELVRAALLKGAVRIDLYINAKKLQLFFRGRPFSQSELEHLYGTVSGARGIRGEAGGPR